MLNAIQYVTLNLMSIVAALIALRILLKPNKYFKVGVVIYLVAAIALFSHVLVFSRPLEFMRLWWLIPYYLFVFCCFDAPPKTIFAALMFYTHIGNSILLLVCLPWQLIGSIPNPSRVTQVGQLWVFVLFLLVLFGGLLLTALLMRKFTVWQRTPMWGLVLMFIVMLVSMVLSIMADLLIEDVAFTSAIVMSSLFMVLFALFVVLISNWYTDKKRMKGLVLQRNLQTQYYQTLQANSDSLQQFLGRLTADTEDIRALLHRGRTAQANQRLQTLTRQVYSLKPTLSSGNSTLDAILQSKYSLAMQQNCKLVSTLQLPESCGIKDMDIVSIATNLLDNALHGCAEQDTVYIGGALRNGMLVLEVKNPVHESQRLPRQPFPHITADWHGIGLMSVRHIAELYGGSFTLTSDEKFVTAQVILLADTE